MISNCNIKIQLDDYRRGLGSAKRVKGGIPSLEVFIGGNDCTNYLEGIRVEVIMCNLIPNVSNIV